MSKRTEFIYLTGKARWARVTTPDPWGNFKITLYLTPESYNKFMELGVKNTVKKDEDGYYVVLRRPQSKMIRGKVVGFAPPSVVDKDGMPIRDQLIGNDSDVTVKVDYYSYSPPGSKEATGKAIRLSGIRVDNLVPYIPNRDFEASEAQSVKGLDEQPEPLF